MNLSKIAFIMAVNNKRTAQESVFYINNLLVPEGMEVEICQIEGATSMCQAYNQGMRQSDAKYKVYLHQDLFIINRNFISDVMNVFLDESIGMIGVTGSSHKFTEDAAYMDFDYCNIISQDPDMTYILKGKTYSQKCIDVFGIDGLIMITQYDINWREDIFKHFDFYDISQSFEFIKAGHRVVLPQMETPWVIHDCGFTKLKNYDEGRSICKKEYPDYYVAQIDDRRIFDSELDSLFVNLKDMLIQLIDSGQWEIACGISDEYAKGAARDTELEHIRNICDIWKADRMESGLFGVFDGMSGYGEIKDKYIELKYCIKRIEYLLDNGMKVLLDKHLEEICSLSYNVIEILITRFTINKQVICEQIIDYFRINEKKEVVEALRKFSEILENKGFPVVYIKDKK